IPFYGIYVLAESAAIKYLATGWRWNLFVFVFGENKAGPIAQKWRSLRVDLLEQEIRPSLPADRREEERRRQETIIEGQFREVMVAVQTFLNSRDINSGAQEELQTALRATLDRTTFEALRDRDARIEADRGLDRKLGYMQGILSAVGRVLQEAADPAISLKNLADYAGQQLIAAFPYAVNFMSYRADREAKRAWAVAWGGKGIYGVLAKLQGIKLKGKMEIDLVMGGDPPRLVGFESAKKIAEPDEIEGVLTQDEKSFLERGLEHTDAGLTERIKGQSSVVGQCILTDKPMLIVETKINPRTGIATARELISAQEVHPNPNMVQALNVYDFMVAPSADGAMLLAVKLPSDMERDEVLRIMDVFVMYSRLVGLIMRTRLLSDEVRAEKEKAEKLSLRAERLTEQLRGALGGHMDPKVAKAIEASVVTGDYSQIKSQPALCTMMFTDIVNSTGIGRAFTGKHGAQQGATMINEFFQDYRGWMGKIASEQGGILDKHIGDGALYLWGTPINNEGNGAEKAVAAAIQMQREGQRFLSSTRWEQIFSELNLSFGMRVGIYTGEVVVGVVASDVKNEYTAIGDPVHRAARFEGQADVSKKREATGVLLCKNTFRQCSLRFLQAEVDAINAAIREYLVKDLRSAEIVDNYFIPSTVDEIFSQRAFGIHIGKETHYTEGQETISDHLEEERGYDLWWDRKRVKKLVLRKMLDPAIVAEDEAAQTVIASNM
ncbi:MAG: adenylate/guanylate cyclase domain-containing protein, partial [Candidatus Margulisbacteria bacterium]|nr:adenylate/guanylate cyclase domain-containing protein [Candidatus Margulisiibacteriota bacterium]